MVKCPNIKMIGYHTYKPGCCVWTYRSPHWHWCHIGFGTGIRCCLFTDILVWQWHWYHIGLAHCNWVLVETKYLYKSWLYSPEPSVEQTIYIQWLSLLLMGSNKVTTPASEWTLICFTCQILRYYINSVEKGKPGNLETFDVRLHSSSSDNIAPRAFNTLK